MGHRLGNKYQGSFWRVFYAPQIPMLSNFAGCNLSLGDQFVTKRSKIDWVRGVSFISVITVCLSPDGLGQGWGRSGGRVSDGCKMQYARG